MANLTDTQTVDLMDFGVELFEGGGPLGSLDISTVLEGYEPESIAALGAAGMLVFTDESGRVVPTLDNSVQFVGLSYAGADFQLETFATSEGYRVGLRAEAGTAWYPTCVEAAAAGEMFHGTVEIVVEENGTTSVLFAL
jgi:hypothetical protein